MRITAVARQLGVSASWLRKLERQGKIPRARRDRLSNQRRYTTEDVEQLRIALYAAQQQRVARSPVEAQVALRLSHTVNGISYGPGLVLNSAS